MLFIIYRAGWNGNLFSRPRQAQNQQKRDNMLPEMSTGCIISEYLGIFRGNLQIVHSIAEKLMYNTGKSQ